MMLSDRDVNKIKADSLGSSSVIRVLKPQAPFASPREYHWRLISRGLVSNQKASNTQNTIGRFPPVHLENARGRPRAPCQSLFTIASQMLVRFSLGNQYRFVLNRPWGPDLIAAPILTTSFIQFSLKGWENVP